MCPVANRALVDHGIERISALCDQVAVNLHYGAEVLDRHLGSEIHRSFERREALGTAGAIGALADWIDGRPVLVTNADGWLGPGSEEAVVALVNGWDGERYRLMCVRDETREDFDGLRYCGVSLMSWDHARRLLPQPSGLYEVAWRDALGAGRVDLFEVDVDFVDCGTASDYLSANMRANSGLSVVDPNARIESGAIVERSVVWGGSTVRAGEVLRDAIRTPHGTVLVR